MRLEIRRGEGPQRALALGLAVLLTAGCGGNFSNEDLRFIAALPDPADLEARVPGLVTGTGQGLRTASVSQGVGLGDQSAWYLDTRRTGEGFNEAVHTVLRLLEHVRRTPPTHREPGKRTWGPFAPEGQRGFEARVVMTHDATLDVYAWAIEFRRRLPADGEWLSLIEGTFRARETVERGLGEVLVHVAEGREAGLDVGGLELVTLALAYDTGGDPIVISLSAENEAGHTLVYTSTRSSDNSGSLQFDLRSPLVDGPQGDETWRMTTRWESGGEGRADVVILEGDGAGAEATECWDGAYRVVYQSVNWLSASVGDVTRCVPPG